MSTHKLIYTGENTHTCAQCNKSFTQTGKLRETIFIDSGEKPHSWTIECKKSFSKAGTLGRHLLMHTGEKPHPCSECEKSLVEMEFWRTICSPTVERSRTDAHSVKRQTKKVVIWELISSFILVRSRFNCQIQFKNIDYGINRGRDEMKNCWFFCLCMWLMHIKIFTCAAMRMDAHICASSAWTAWIRNWMANPKKYRASKKGKMTITSINLLLYAPLLSLWTFFKGHTVSKLFTSV